MIEQGRKESKHLIVMDNLKRPSKMSIGSNSPQNHSVEDIRYSHDYANIQNHLREALD